MNRPVFRSNKIPRSASQYHERSFPRLHRPRAGGSPPSAADAPRAAAAGAAAQVGQDRADASRADAQTAVTALYEAHALGLVRLAYVMLGDRAAAEDVV